MRTGYLLQCATCGTPNRIPHEDAGSPGRCSRCGAPLIASNALPEAVSDRGFDDAVLGDDAPALVEVWSPRCGVCAQYELAVRQMAVNLYGKARVFQLDIEQNPAIPARYGVTGVPTVLVFRDRRLKAVLPGPRGEQGLREALGV